MSKLASILPDVLHSAEVRAYLLKPLPAKSSVEISEIQPAELAATDLDVRLTLVGTEGDSGMFLRGATSSSDSLIRDSTVLCSAQQNVVCVEHRRPVQVRIKYKIAQLLVARQPINGHTGDISI
jgi:hypothetical protein